MSHPGNDIWNERHAELIDETKSDLYDIFKEVLQEFPGLLDGESDVNGADLVQFLTDQLEAYPSVKILWQDYDYGR